MKKSLTVIAALIVAASAYGQGQIYFNNYSSGNYAFKIYGPEPGNPTLQVQGNTATAIPAGSTVYTGTPLDGSLGTYSFELFGGPSTVTDSSALQACTLNGTPYIAGFRSGNAAGYISPSGGMAVTVPGVNIGSTATLQLRAWDNASGTLATYASAEAAPNGVYGSSALFTSQPLGGETVQPPFLTPGATSFNIHTQVPEPSTIALGVIGAAGFLARRRKQQ